jgi:hypothetical protein
LDELHRNQIRDSDGEGLFIGFPMAFLADVLAAEHADGLALRMDRHIQHRTDAERAQIVVVQFLRAPVLFHVMGDDDIGIGQGAEIRRALAAPNSVPEE